jgi:predicted transcriptional regulator
MQTRVMTAHVDIALAKKIDQYAAQMERPRGWIIKQALRQWIATEEWKHQGTLDSIADADAGNLFSQKEIEAWVNSVYPSAKNKRTKKI